MTAPETSSGPRSAADWRARLDSAGAAEADFVAFTAWLEENPAHRAAFDQLDAVLADVDAQKEHLAGHKVVRFPVWKKTAAVAAIAASILAVFLVARPPSGPGPQTAWETRTGERKDVTLADGSVIHLNTATRVSVDFDHGARNARLENGEALFEVTPDANHPFTVTAGDQRIEVIGTAFNVLRHDGAIAVTVSHGVVRASATGKAEAATPARLIAGNLYSRREGESVYAVTMVDAGAATAWRDGRLAYDGAELSKVVSDLNRNFDTQVTLADAALGNLRFSGVLKLDSAEAVVRRLEGFLPISATPQGNGIVVRARDQ